MILNGIADGIFVVIQGDEVFDVGKILGGIRKSEIPNARIEVRQALRRSTHDLNSGHRWCHLIDATSACIDIIMDRVDGRNGAVKHCD